MEFDIEKAAREYALEFLNKEYPSAHPLNWDLKLIGMWEADNMVKYRFDTHIPVLGKPINVIYGKNTQSFHIYGR